MPESTLRLAVAQTSVYDDPRDIDQLRASGNELRRLMRQASAAGARVVHFTEGATCFPNKYLMSVDGPDQVGDSDWSRFQWDVLREELASIASLAGELKLWTVLGSVHRLTEPTRPHNSMYVISDQGTVATRYDERTLSHTKITHMYTPGVVPVTFEVEGFRFGCALGMDVHFPELFAQYERLDVECVLISHNTAGTEPNTATPTEARGNAATNTFWISYAVVSEHSPVIPSGVINPDGDWTAQCTTDGNSSIAVLDLERTADHPLSPLARTWRHRTRAGLSDVPLADDRSTVRTGF